MKKEFRADRSLHSGICGGVWSEKWDVRLGDVVVSEPHGKHPGVVQWDLGKNESAGEYLRQGSLNKPPRSALTVVAKLKADPNVEATILPGHVTNMFSEHSHLLAQYGRPTQEDRLFQWSSIHHGPQGSSCAHCDINNLVKRTPRPDPRAIKLHYGNIASGNTVMKNAQDRDRIARRDDIIAYEMEAAGIMDYRALVIRGVCDYADSHKNDEWHNFAAVAAAAYAKTLLHAMPAKIGARERIRGKLVEGMSKTRSHPA